MGIVLVRRDNAPIVKLVCNGIINQIINKRDKKGALEFTKRVLMDIITGKYDADKFIISKTLKTTYKNAKQSIAHVALAEKMGQRDPGNKPQSNDRIPYVYIENDKAKLQGERVEHPDYVAEHKIKIDYAFYITNQIMKPALQFLELISKNAKKIFKDCLLREENRKKGVMPLGYYFDISKGSDANLDCLESVYTFDHSIITKTLTEPKKRVKKKPKILTDQEIMHIMKFTSDP